MKKVISFLCSITNYGIASFIVRWILGILFLVGGWWKVFVLTPAEHTRMFFLEGFADTWIPEFVLIVLGNGIPTLELLAGTMLVFGYRVREVLVGLGVLLIITTYGHALLEPLFNPDGHTFTRLAMIVFLLVIPQGHDKLTADYWFKARRK